VARLFRDHPVLLQQFAAFLPPGNKLADLKYLKTAGILSYKRAQTNLAIHYTDSWAGNILAIEGEIPASKLIHISSTISQNQTSGEAGRLEKILSEFHTIIRPASEIYGTEVGRKKTQPTPFLGCF
jgi:hypothetical protein